MMVQRMKKAYAGRSMWLKLKATYDIDRGVYVLLMPEDDDELNEQTLAHIDDLVAHRGARAVLILTNKQWIIQKAKICSDKILAAVEVSEALIDGLLSYYELYAFSERLLIVSLTRPYGRKLYQSLGIHGVTREDLVCLCILGIRDWTGKGY